MCTYILIHMYVSIALAQIYFKMDFYWDRKQSSFKISGVYGLLPVSAGLWECQNAVGFCGLAAPEYCSNSGAKE